MNRSPSAKMEEEIDRLTHDAEHAEVGAALARQMKDIKSAKQMDVKAAHLRQHAADLQLALPLVMARESREKETTETGG
jgi:hypothetical protein